MKTKLSLKIEKTRRKKHHKTGKFKRKIHRNGKNGNLSKIGNKKWKQKNGNKKWKQKNGNKNCEKSGKQNFKYFYILENSKICLRKKSSKSYVNSFSKSKKQSKNDYKM